MTPAQPLFWQDARREIPFTGGELTSNADSLFTITRVHLPMPRALTFALLILHATPIA